MNEASTPTDWFLSFSHLIYSQVQLKNTKLSRATWCWPSDLIFPPPSPNDDRTNHDWRLYVLSRYCAPYHHCMHIRSGSQIVYFIFYFWQSFYFLSGESHVCTHTSSRLYRMFLYYSSLSLSFFLSFIYVSLNWWVGKLQILLMGPRAIALIAPAVTWGERNDSTPFNKSW